MIKINDIYNAICELENNKVKTIKGKYEVFLKRSKYKELLDDNEYQILLKGINFGEKIFKFNNNVIDELLDVRFIESDVDEVFIYGKHFLLKVKEK